MKKDEKIEEPDEDGLNIPAINSVIYVWDKHDSIIVTAYFKGIEDGYYGVSYMLKENSTIYYYDKMSIKNPLK